MSVISRVVTRFVKLARWLYVDHACGPVADHLLEPRTPSRVDLTDDPPSYVVDL